MISQYFWTTKIEIIILALKKINKKSLDAYWVNPLSSFFTITSLDVGEIQFSPYNLV
jgi:hypothetical protein